METENKNNSTQTTEQEPESKATIFIGITGNSGNNDLAMAKLWISDGVIIKLEIHSVGTEYTVSRAENAMRQLSGKTLKEVELYLDYSLSSPQREQPEFDPIFEAVIRALDNFHKPVEDTKPDDPTPEPQPLEDVTESNDEQIPANQDPDSESTPE